MTNNIVTINVEGLSVVITGDGPAPRDTLEELLKQAGATVQTKVKRGSTDLLICDPSLISSIKWIKGERYYNTKKLNDAQGAGIRIVSYDDVFNIQEGDERVAELNNRFSIQRAEQRKIDKARKELKLNEYFMTDDELEKECIYDGNFVR